MIQEGSGVPVGYLEAKIHKKSISGWFLSALNHWLKRDLPAICVAGDLNAPKAHKPPYGIAFYSPMDSAYRWRASIGTQIRQAICALGLTSETFLVSGLICRPCILPYAKRRNHQGIIILLGGSEPFLRKCPARRGL